MTDQVSGFSQGDWIVHINYGVGQIRGVETKVLNGKEVTFYRVKTRNSTFWVPLDQTDTPRLRPLASRGELKKVFKVLNNPPQEMDPDHNNRKQRINQVKGEGSLLSISRLVRDLHARQDRTNLNATEELALNRFTERLLREWSVCMQIPIDDAQRNLQNMLTKHLAKEDSG